MRYALFLLAVTACGSENKVDDDPGRNGTQNPPETNNGTTPTGDTDNPPGDDDDTDGSPGDDDDDDTDSPPTGTDTGELTGDEICEAAAALTITLDPYQTPDDGRVIYCHGGNAEGGTLNYIETDISSCLPHLNHSADVFPTTGCDS